MWTSVGAFAWGALTAVWGYLCRLASFPLAFVYEWRGRRFERRGVAARRRELLSGVVRGGSVLEVGAGAGATLAAGAYAGAPGRFARVVCTEPDPGMRARLATRAKAEPVVEVAAAHLPRLSYPNAEFDAVVAFMVLSQVGDRSGALDEICRVLKPSGKLLLMDHAAHAVDALGALDDGDYWFVEWFRFVHVRGGKKKASIQVLLSDIAKEERLVPDFVSTMETHGFFKEICYASYTRR